MSASERGHRPDVHARGRACGGGALLGRGGGLRVRQRLPAGHPARPRGRGVRVHARRTARRSTTAQLERIRKLAIPPAWTDVWICGDPDGHIQATGRDKRGRKQYRYHERWRAVRDETKFDRMLALRRRAARASASRVDADLRARALRREKLLALLVALLDTTLIRIGNAGVQPARTTRSASRRCETRTRASPAPRCGCVSEARRARSASST